MTITISPDEGCAPRKHWRTGFVPCLPTASPPALEAWLWWLTSQVWASLSWEDTELRGLVQPSFGGPRKGMFSLLVGAIPHSVRKKISLRKMTAPNLTRARKYRDTKSHCLPLQRPPWDKEQPLNLPHLRMPKVLHISISHVHAQLRKLKCYFYNYFIPFLSIFQPSPPLGS